MLSEKYREIERLIKAGREDAVKDLVARNPGVLSEQYGKDEGSGHHQSLLITAMMSGKSEIFVWLAQESKRKIKDWDIADYVSAKVDGVDGQHMPKEGTGEGARVCLEYLRSYTTTEQKNEINLLALAVYFNDVELVETLLKGKEIEVNTKAARLASPLRLATPMSERMEIEKLLLGDPRVVTAGSSILSYKMQEGLFEEAHKWLEKYYFDSKYLNKRDFKDGLITLLPACIEHEVAEEEKIKLFKGFLAFGMVDKRFIAEAGMYSMLKGSGEENVIKVLKLYSKLLESKAGGKKIPETEKDLLELQRDLELYYAYPKLKKHIEEGQFDEFKKLYAKHEKFIDQDRKNALLGHALKSYDGKAFEYLVNKGASIPKAITGDDIFFDKEFRPSLVQKKSMDRIFSIIDSKTTIKQKNQMKFFFMAVAVENLPLVKKLLKTKDIIYNVHAGPRSYTPMRMALMNNEKGDIRELLLEDSRISKKGSLLLPDAIAAKDLDRAVLYLKKHLFEREDFDKSVSKLPGMAMSDTPVDEKILKLLLASGAIDMNMLEADDKLKSLRDAFGNTHICRVVNEYCEILQLQAAGKPIPEDRYDLLVLKKELIDLSNQLYPESKSLADFMAQLDMRPIAKAIDGDLVRDGTDCAKIYSRMKNARVMGFVAKYEIGRLDAAIEARANRPWYAKAWEGFKDMFKEVSISHEDKLRFDSISNGLDKIKKARGEKVPAVAVEEPTVEKIKGTTVDMVPEPESTKTKPKAKKAVKATEVKTDRKSKAKTAKSSKVGGDDLAPAAKRHAGELEPAKVKDVKKSGKPKTRKMAPEEKRTRSEHPYRVKATTGKKRAAAPKGGVARRIAKWEAKTKGDSGSARTH